MNKKDGSYSFIQNVTNRLQSIIYLTTTQRDVSAMCEDLLFMLDDYMGPKIKKFRDNPEEFDIKIDDDYEQNLHRVRTISLSLFSIEVIPSPDVGRSRLMFSEVMGDDKVQGVSQTMNYRQTMMYYLEARRKLTEYIESEPDAISNPFNALHFLLDIGFSMLAPYILEEEYGMWEQSCKSLVGVGNFVDNPEMVNKSKINKIVLQSQIMHRQSFQMSYRDIDRMGYQQENEDVIEEYKNIKGDD